MIAPHMRAVLLGVAVLVGCGSEHALVDGRCRDGFFEQDGRCLFAESAGGADEGSPSAGETSAGDPSPSGASPSARTGGARVRFPGLDAGSASADASIADAAADAPLTCAAPMFACKDTCMTGDDDPRNCGACGKTCASNICSAGECQGATTGHVVLIGHDYAGAWTTAAQVKVLVNAVAMPTTDPIRVLAFDGDTPQADAASTRSLVSDALQGRAVAFTRAADATALESAELARSFDVLLLQGAAADGAALGTRWSSALDTFTHKGGVLVAIDDGRSSMPELLASSGALPIGSHAPLSGAARVTVASPGDAVGLQVVSPYAPTGASVGFLGLPSSPDLTIVADAEGMPVVVHRVVR